ncbi:uncharacterized protein LOC127099624 [Lathyrus oleraceus]|uniref:uncharacterized protein LOC127099624 n=1 Tax=Pisum sativum TaxID=3888 RepID=UPI0021CEB2E5|nr:uncharacterized protein LOC127099624 [Pisum sativum]
MVVDEEVQAGNVSKGDSPDVEGTDNDPQGGNDDQDEEVVEEEEEEVEEPPVFDDAPDADDGEELEDQDDNGEGGQGEINEGQPQGQTPVTPTTKVIPKGIRASTRATMGHSLEELVALKQSQPLEYLKAMLSRRESSYERSLSTSTTSEDQSSSRPANEALLSQVNLLDVSPEVANIILELGTMIGQVVEDNKLLLQITKEIEQKIGVEAASCDAASKSTNKALELEETKKKNQTEIENHDRDIAS